jgi:hypothetical protein
MTRHLIRILIFAATVLMMSTAGAGAALAHNEQMSSSPADGEILPSPHPNTAKPTTLSHSAFLATLSDR